MFVHLALAEGMCRPIYIYTSVYVCVCQSIDSSLNNFFPWW